MTAIQEVFFEMEADYLGHPYYVTGHALFNAIARRVDAVTRRALHVSHGMFVPGEFGSYPDAHSQSGGVPYMGTGLRPVEAYDDLFVFRDAAQRWLSDTRPRDAHNTHELRSHGRRTTFAPTTIFGRPPEARNTKRSVSWYIHCYLYADHDGESIIPLSDDVLDGIRVGGGRNYGLGELSLKETQTVELDALSYSRLRDADEYIIELISPYVLASEFLGADEQSIPWWWETATSSPATATGMPRSGTELRQRAEQLVVGDNIHRLKTVDHGQVVGYTGDAPVKTAMNGLLRVGTHAKYGFGEFRIRPATDDRVPGRRADEVQQQRRGDS